MGDKTSSSNVGELVSVGGNVVDIGPDCDNIN